MPAVPHSEFPPYLNLVDGPKMAHDAMTGASAGFGGRPDLQNPPALTGLQQDGQADTPNLWSSDGASRRRIFERECPYHQGDAVQELPMFRFVEYFPGNPRPYIGDSYGNQTFICWDEDKPCSPQCDCRELGSQPNDFTFIATKTSMGLSITFYDSALVAAISGEASIPNTKAWAVTTFDGLAILAQYAQLKQYLELLDPSLAIVPTLRLLVEGFLADGQVFKKFGYNNLFERGYLSLELWKEFQHRQLDDDITLLDDTFSAVAEERSQDNFGDAAVDGVPAVEDMPLHSDIISDFDTQTQKIPSAPMPGMWFEEAVPRPFEEAPPSWMPSEGDTLKEPDIFIADWQGHMAKIQSILGRPVPHTDELLEQTRLVIAARRGHESVVRMLLDRGADINHESFSGTPLLAAAERGHESMVRLLLDRGVDVDHRWTTPLLAAARGGHESVVRLLLDRGADGWTTPLLAAVERGHKSVVRLLLKRGADVNHRWTTPLLAAARGGHESVVRLLLDRGADVNRGPLSETPLLIAVEGGHESVVRMLLDRGADINHESFSRTPLLAAAERGHESMVRLLLDRGADVNHGWTTPLLAAARGGHESVVRLLLDRGADVNRGPLSETPLLIAVEGGHESVVRLLLDRGADVNRGPLSETPLLTAVEEGHEYLIRLLAHHGASLSDRTNVLQEALKRGWNETAHHLFKLGWRSPPDRALVVRMLRELRNQKEAANQRSHLYMTTCYNAFVGNYGRVKTVAGLRRDKLVDMSIQLKCLVAHSPGWKFNESVRDRFADYRTAWQSGIKTLRRVSGGRLPEDPGEVLAFLCVCKAVSDTLDFFTGSGYTTIFFADLRRWGLLFKDSFDCYNHLIRGVWGIDVTNEQLSPSSSELLQYAQGLVSSLVGAASGLIRPTAEGGRDGLEASQLRWLERDATRRDVKSDRGPVGREPPGNHLLETPRLSKMILDDMSSTQISGELVILTTGAAFLIILIFLLWLRVSIQGIQAAPMFASLRLFSLSSGGVTSLVWSCMVLEMYLGLRSKAHEFAHSWAPSDLNTPSPPEAQALSISPSQPGDARDNANGSADLDSPVQQSSTSVFSARTGEVGRRNDRFCDDCQRPFATRTNYLRHRREKHDLNKVVCPLCGKRLARQDYLATHLAKNKCHNRRKGGRLVLG